MPLGLPHRQLEEAQEEWELETGGPPEVRCCGEDAARNLAPDHPCEQYSTTFNIVSRPDAVRLAAQAAP